MAGKEQAFVLVRDWLGEPPPPGEPGDRRPFALVGGKAVATWSFAGGRVTLTPFGPLDVGVQASLDAVAVAVDAVSERDEVMKFCYRMAVRVLKKDGYWVGLPVDIPGSMLGDTLAELYQEVETLKYFCLGTPADAAVDVDYRYELPGLNVDRLIRGV